MELWQENVFHLRHLRKLLVNAPKIHLLVAKVCTYLLFVFNSAINLIFLGFGGLAINHGSLFSLSNRGGPSVVYSRSKVEFKRIECVLASQENGGTTSFEDLGEKLSGFLRDIPFSCGTMKCAYDVCFKSLS